MRLRILHETRYDYRPPVSDGQHVAHLQPIAHDRQQLLNYALRIEPRPAAMHASIDDHGNVCHHFSIAGAHDRLVVQSESLVQTWAPLPQDPFRTAGWEQVQAWMRTGAAPGAVQRFTAASAHVPLEPAFATFARPSFAPGRPIAAAARDLMRRLHRHMRYEPRSTRVDTPALQALQQAAGVCQDFAHILVACCRTLGLPARYVSGYLLTQPPPGQARLIGCDASHAWASVFCPLAGHDGRLDPSEPGYWLDLDPTNDRSPGEDYVSVAIGRDFQDVSPLTGFIRGSEHQVLTVAVTVLPQEPDPEPPPARASPD